VITSSFSREPVMRAATLPDSSVFGNSLALSRLDEESGQNEERLVTIGRNPREQSAAGRAYLKERATVRIIGSPANTPRSPAI
jgi:hypothetical protein